MGKRSALGFADLTVPIGYAGPAMLDRPDAGVWSLNFTKVSDFAFGSCIELGNSRILEKNRANLGDAVRTILLRPQADCRPFDDAALWMPINRGGPNDWDH